MFYFFNAFERIAILCFFEHGMVLLTFIIQAISENHLGAEPGARICSFKFGMVLITFVIQAIEKDQLGAWSGFDPLCLEWS